MLSKVVVTFPFDTFLTEASGLFRNLCNALLQAEMTKWESKGICPVCRKSLASYVGTGSKRIKRRLERVHKKGFQRGVIVLYALSDHGVHGRNHVRIDWATLHSGFVRHHIDKKCLAVAGNACHAAYDDRKCGGHKRVLSLVEERRLAQRFMKVDWTDPANLP